MNTEKMNTEKTAVWARGLLGLLAILILGTTIPAYLNTASNPALAHLSGEVSGLGSVAGAFLGRQLTIALLALFTAWYGIRICVIMGAFGIFFFNFHDALFLGLIGGNVAGAVAGLVLAAGAAVVAFKAVK